MSEMLEGATAWRVAVFAPVWRLVAEAAGVFWSVIRRYLRIDRYLACILVLFAVLFVPPLPQAADDPQILAAFFDDEPWQALALDGTLAWPYGNPANYLDPTSRAYSSIPAYWGYLRFPGITYYGGAMYELATPVYAGLHALGFPPFPTVIVVLRGLSALAALVSLIVLYNFACRFGCRAAGVMALLYWLADPYFVMFTVFAHPDMLQALFGLFALVLAVRHAERGDLPSLAALGFACGLVQGAKMGGPWTVPMAALALWWGAQKAGVALADYKASGKRVLILGATSATAWLATNPFALVDLYYLRMLVSTWRIQGSTAAEGPFGVITMWSWAEQIYAYIGPLGAMLCAMAVARLLFGLMAGRANRAFILALVLCASQFLVYGSGKYWVVVYYLLLSAGLMAVLAFDTAVVLARYAATAAFGGLRHERRMVIAPRLATALLACAFVVVYAPYGLAAVVAVLDRQLYRSSTPLMLNEWAKQNIGRDDKVMFTAHAYFDLNWFRNIVWETKPTWRGIAGEDPDYLVLSSCIYDTPHYKELIATQSLDEDEANLYHGATRFSVRVYQDLLKTEQFGPTARQGVEYVQQVAVIPWPSAGERWLPMLEAPWPGWAIDRVQLTDFYLRRAVGMVEEIASPPEYPVKGCDFRVYRFNPPGTPNGRPVAFASSEQPGHEARRAFDGDRDFWQATPANGPGEPYIGYDFGDHSARGVRQVRVEWVDASATPSAIRVEASNDRERWATAGDFAVAPYAADERPHRTDAFALEPGPAYRYWRIVAEGDGAQRRFAVAELYFVPEKPAQP